MSASKHIKLKLNNKFYIVERSREGDTCTCGEPMDVYSREDLACEMHLKVELEAIVSDTPRR